MSHPHSSAANLPEPSVIPILGLHCGHYFYRWKREVLSSMGKASVHEAKADFSAAIAPHSTARPERIQSFIVSGHKADFATMPGASHAPFAVITQTMKRSIPLIYSGQEEPVLRSIKFFDKDTIQFGKYARGDFYTKLLTLHNSNAALSANASFTRLPTKVDNKVYAYVREMNGRKVVVITNLSNTVQSFTIDNPLISGNATEIFSGKKEQIAAGQSFGLNPWGYLVYSY